MNNRHLERLRFICMRLPETTEKLSHGEPTFFVRKKVFAMFADNHHKDGHIAVWLPAPAGVQTMLIEGSPEKFFKPPYVGVRGWIGVELGSVGDSELAFHVMQAWRLIAPPKLRASFEASQPTRDDQQDGSEKERQPVATPSKGGAKVKSGKKRR